MRARNLKPGFFKNENLAECHPLARILFSGLWCMADREGRLEDRPVRIRAELLPYDDCNADDLLCQLAERGFIQRYEVEGGRYIQISNFVKHQNPHKQEKTSDILGPSDSVPKSSSNYSTSPENNGSRPADSLFSDSLIPSSLNPDSLISGSADEEETLLQISNLSVICQETRAALRKISFSPTEIAVLKSWDADYTMEEISGACAKAKEKGAGRVNYIDQILREGRDKKANEPVYTPDPHDDIIRRTLEMHRAGG